MDNQANVFMCGSTGGALMGNVLGDDDVFAAKYDALGNKVWGIQFGTSALDVAVDIAVDSYGNSFMVGNTTAALPGCTFSGEVDAFLVKLSPTGSILWYRQIGTANEDSTCAVALDNSGNIYVTGMTYGRLFGNGAVCEDGALFIAKYNQAGEQVWGKQYDNTDGFACVCDIGVDSQGNIYLAGQTEGYFDHSRKTQDAFLAKYDSSGTLIWGREFGTDYIDEASSLAIYEDSVYVAGSLNDMSGDDRRGTCDGFLAKYSSAGNQLWLRQQVSSGDDGNNCVAVDSQGRVCIVGSTNGALFCDSSGRADAYMVTYDKYGNLEKGVQMGSATDDSAVFVAFTSAGDLLVSGNTESDFCGTSVGGCDAYIVKYAASVP